MTAATKLDFTTPVATGDIRPRWEERLLARAATDNHELFVERSRQIVAAAYDLLEEDGLEGLTIRAVLARTGLARRAFYERFAGKDDLVLAVFEQTIRLAARHFGAMLATIPDPVEQLRMLVSCIAMGASSLDVESTSFRSRRSAALSREHLRLAESRPDELQAALSPLVMLFAQVLSSGMAAGRIRQHAPQRLATLIYNLVSTTVITELVGQVDSEADRNRRTELAGDIWDFCWRAVAA